MSRTGKSPHAIVFRLYVVGDAPNSVAAIANLNALCRKHFPDNHRIEIIDVIDDPRRFLADKILATPTLIKLSPPPVFTVIGNLSEEAKLLSLLGIPPLEL